MSDKMNCVTLWVEGDIPEDYDWNDALPEGVRLADSEDGYSSQKVKTFPWNNVYHEVNWWITRPMTLEEWIELDDKEGKVLSDIVGDDFMGTAGPIPFPEKDEE